MSFQMSSLVCRLASSLIAASCISLPALAESNGPYVPLLPTYSQECGACHIAYSPALMPAASWRRIMSKLSNHFGTDASLDPASTRELSSWINSHAGTYKRVSEEPPQDRITRTAWFVRKHHEVSAASWKNPAVKSAANCIACHTTAEKGDFNERNIRIPR